MSIRSSVSAMMFFTTAQRFHLRLSASRESLWIGVLLIGYLSPFYVFCQTSKVADKAAPQAVNPVENNLKADPDYVSYREFFQDVVILDMAAAKTDSAGKRLSSGYRLDDQASLSTEEGMLLKMVAYDLNRALAEHNANVREEVTAFRSLNRSVYPGKVVPVTPELRREQEEGGERIVNSHVEQLKKLLAESSFLKVDTYVKRRFKAPIANRPSVNAGPVVR